MLYGIIYNIALLSVFQYGPYNVRGLKVGESKLWCACGLSRSQPWCDGEKPGGWLRTGQGRGRDLCHWVPRSLGGEDRGGTSVTGFPAHWEGKIGEEPLSLGSPLIGRGRSGRDLCHWVPRSLGGEDRGGTSVTGFSAHWEGKIGEGPVTGFPAHWEGKNGE